MDYYQMIIHVVIGFLASSVKNPTSSRAQRVRTYVLDLQEAVDEFLTATDPNTKKK